MVCMTRGNLDLSMMIFGPDTQIGFYREHAAVVSARTLACCPSHRVLTARRRNAWQHTVAAAASARKSPGVYWRSAVQRGDVAEHGGAGGEPVLRPLRRAARAGRGRRRRGVP